MSEVTLFMNCRVLQDETVRRGELWMRGPTIIDPSTVSRKADKIIDCRNGIVAPGFIDIQLNGAFGVDFLMHEDRAAGLAHVRKELPSTGVVAFCPTLITCPAEIFAEASIHYPKLAGNGKSGATVLGTHLEGPFISPEKKGAHPIECIKNFDEGFKTVTDHYGEDLSNVSIVTLAVEKEGSPEIVEELVSRGVKVSLGHSVASLSDAQKAVAAGANCVTHLFNAMPAFHHRDPSLPGLLVDREKDRVHFGIIADGLHTHPCALQIAYRMHSEGLCLITDAIGPMGLPAGNYKLGTVDCVVEGEPLRAYVKGTDTLCGAVCPMDECVRYFYKQVECSLAYVLSAASLHPARCLGIQDRKGHLGVGADADIVILDDSLQVLKTFVAGEVAYERSM
ncbi:MAG: hypothetical protein KVP17_000909 [Porospora cf. gigantea B]|uniref:uncharacterized protein n=1 Tax=Porospora cf. gigantea B TaxID=2853592 RepID=UPI0035718900|nr:MAG: hypothetical protein KVP17_000909 [Porospora cf. gigantea B]